MTPSADIARVLGRVLMIIGLGLLLEGETFRAMAGEFLRSAALIFFSGLITLAVGLAILNVHHLWTRDWRSIITVFGWLALIGGIFRILAPNFVQEIGESFIAHRRWPIMGAIVTLALGICANTALFSVVRNVILKPLPNHDPERLASVWMEHQHGRFEAPERVA